MAFVREHWRPLTGAAGLHIGLLAVLAFAAWQWPRSQPPVQLAIAGVVVDANALPAARDRPQAATPPVTTPEPPPEPEPQKVDDSLQKEQAAEAERLALERAELERTQQQEREAAEIKAAEAKAADAKRSEQEEQRKRDALEAQHKAEAAEKQRKDLEAKRKQEAKAAADAKQQAAREAELRRSLAAEEEASEVARSGVVDEYRRMLIAAIERNWNRPPSARAGLECTLHVSQAPGGTVIDVRVGDCNGDQAVRESITNAVFNASPLPPPPDARAFERRLEIVFKPTE